jgi:dethiobiotin synthetase
VSGAPGASRPTILAFVTGTGTEVGKTWWAAAAAHVLRGAGVAVAARKPAQSGTPGDGPSDAAVLAAATGEPAGAVCPPQRSYDLAWAPPMAARELGAPAFGVADLATETVWAPGTDVGLVEGAGGPRSPIADDGDNVDLARLLSPDVVILVTDLRLGAINAVRLAAAPFTGVPLVVACNRYEPDALSRRTLEVLRADGFELVTTPEELAARLWPPHHRS